MVCFRIPQAVFHSGVSTCGITALILLSFRLASCDLVAEVNVRGGATTPKFVCKNRNGKQISIPLSAVNDDFCDCLGDGRDEYNTPACPIGEFECENDGYIPRKIPTSQLFDGICDCEDGSDEKSDTCPDLSHQKAGELVQRLESQLEEFEEALAVRDELIEMSSEIRETSEIELQQLSSWIEQYEYYQYMLSQDGRASQEQQLQAYYYLEQISLYRDTLNRLLTYSGKDTVQYGFGKMDEFLSLQGTCFTKELIQRRHGAPEAENPITEDYYVMEVCPFCNATQWVIEKDTPEYIIQRARKREKRKLQNPKQAAASTSPASGDGSEQCDGEDCPEQENGGQAEIVKSDEKDELQPYPWLPEGYHIKQAYSLGIFYQWGNSKIRDQFGGESRSQSYVDGSPCWNGPKERTLSVVVHCGLNDDLISVRENGKCRYEMEFTTPAACNPALLEELEEELENHNERFDF